ncbi:MAG TPA: hypothetical protein VF190_14535 [Rhodothermales bacterium]
MSNGIHPLRPGGANPYLQSTHTARTADSRPDAERAAAATPAARPAPSTPAALQGLSTDEAEMIESLFPEGPTSLRLYGPHGGNQQITPRAVGGRLDLSA